MPSPRETETEIVLMVQPGEANPLGRMHGGRVMYLIDEVGGICAMRHCHRSAVTVSMDQVVFHNPILVGSAINLHARINWAGRHSLEVEVCVQSENLLTGERQLTTTALLTYVALDDQGRPTTVPALALETDEDRTRFDAGEERHRSRIATRDVRSGCTQPETETPAPAPQ